VKTVIYLFFLTALIASCNIEAEKEAFLIPEGYTGTIAVLFDQENGAPKESKEDTRLYRIPNNGVLYTQFSRVTGNLNQKFYYVNSSGDKEELSSLFLPLLPTKEYDSTKVYALRGFDGKFGKVKYIYFAVGKAAQSDSLARASHKYMDRIREIYPEQIK
jgi:hypothetical protein